MGLGRSQGGLDRKISEKSNLNGKSQNCSVGGMGSEIPNHTLFTRSVINYALQIHLRYQTLNSHKINIQMGFQNFQKYEFCFRTPGNTDSSPNFEHRFETENAEWNVCLLR